MQSSWYPEIIHYPDRIWGITQLLCQDCKLVLQGRREAAGRRPKHRKIRKTLPTGGHFNSRPVGTVLPTFFLLTFLTDKPEKNLMQLLLKTFSSVHVIVLKGEPSLYSPFFLFAWRWKSAHLLLHFTHTNRHQQQSGVKLHINKPTDTSIVHRTARRCTAVSHLQH